MEDRLEQALERIAAHLDGWTLTGDGPRDNAAYLVGPEGVRVLASRPWNEKGKVSFCVSPENGLHRFEAYNADKPKATVSADRDPEAAARDVKRRCLDPAVPYVLALREKKAAKDAVDAGRWAALEALAEIVEGEIHRNPIHGSNEDNPMEAKVSRGGYGVCTATFKLTYGRTITTEEPASSYGPDRVNVEIRDVEMKDAAALARWLRRRLWPRHGEQGELF